MKTIDEKNCTYKELFENIGLNNCIHVNKKAFNINLIRNVQSQLNREYRIQKGNYGLLKYRVIDYAKKGYITIFQIGR